MRRNTYEIVLLMTQHALQKLRSKQMPDVRSTVKRQVMHTVTTGHRILSPSSNFASRPYGEFMAALDLHMDQKTESLAANLRKAFSGITR
ncbi:DUF3412 domain-containing protein [Vibrio lentus]|nr:DUF3412 domain-containing protein [Vibrio lentus]